MTATPIAIDVVPIDAGVVLAITGEVDLLTAERLTKALAVEVARHPLVIVDLTAVEFLSSSGLTALALAHRAASVAGHELRLVATNRVTLRPLQITGLAEQIAVFPTIPDAEAGGDPAGSPSARS